VILAQNGCPVEVIAAGILHDVIEDTPITVDDLRLQFGKKVASIVEKCSEPDKSLSWRERKQHTIDFLAKASMEVKFVACADKLDNITSIALDYDELGEDFWQRFNAGKEEQSWYYHGLVKSLSKGKFAKTDLFRYFEEKVDDVFKLCPPSNLIDSLDFAKAEKLGYRLVIEDGMFFLFKDGVFPVLVTDSSVNVADWLVEHN
jgi:hypothetical protein